jgi:hypothetical protein
MSRLRLLTVLSVTAIFVHRAGCEPHGCVIGGWTHLHSAVFRWPDNTTKVRLSCAFDLKPLLNFLSRAIHAPNLRLRVLERKRRRRK